MEICVPLRLWLRAVPTAVTRRLAGERAARSRASIELSLLELCLTISPVNSEDVGRRSMTCKQRFQTTSILQNIGQSNLYDGMYGMHAQSSLA
ncbi:unnamed protein product [Alternaria burnsii]|nr:unnamed protein product [Alternaria burnsii]